MPLLLQVEFQDLEGHSALHAACNSCALPVVSLLLAAGADPGLLSREGYTPLDLVWPPLRAQAEACFKQARCGGRVGGLRVGVGVGAMSQAEACFK